MAIQPADLSDDELISRAESLHQSVHVAECFGSRDVLELELCLAELEARGFTVDEGRQLRIQAPAD